MGCSEIVKKVCGLDLDHISRKTKQAFQPGCEATTGFELMIVTAKLFRQPSCLGFLQTLAPVLFTGCLLATSKKERTQLFALLRGDDGI